ncbi:group II intron reverse transcriptase/maturase [Paenactinomyces guangxiensis]|uniref:RNA-directed DNA polymerase n=1 Tax=Paenactinomyces guangxiensis TaxID=1490290 RepID=A0A7W2A904_9BACL|nr:group II intron reverse transcriptase/maturase [Paenactinomyces guangxiensis]MBA4495185.1 group II intron reverse transcriptase/maturase [Paenactinomyces guangxiensis]MBH8592131.1 group II intron reverse transcriptase/maturase [Paenactinomyces guangxiensis]
MNKAKPFQISKKEVWEAYKQVKENRGAAGVDGQSIEEFERDLRNNLYKLWNRMSSGSYFPPPVRRVNIPKSDGGIRPLGIPTVMDRIAQTVVKRHLEPELEVHFHPDSYGYRPKKSAIEAVGVARKRCWQYNWVLDLDIKGFFDNIDHVLLMKAVHKHTDCKWVILYIERWLKAPVQEADGILVKREKGTPQGGVISPLLANLFLHYTFDRWMQIHQPNIPFERYADDVICHCKSEEQAQKLLTQLKQRFAECGLDLHPQKTKVVYCKDDDRKGNYPNETFDFLGFTFRPRLSKNRWGKCFINFTPAISNKAARKIRQTMRSWRLQLRSDKSLDDLACMLNPVIQGWMNYYSSYYKSAFYPTLHYLDRIIVRWAIRKFKRLKGRRQRARQWLRRISEKEPYLFTHWRFLKVTAER